MEEGFGIMMPENEAPMKDIMRLYIGLERCLYSNMFQL
jgi:hypothetical protein